MVIYMSSRHIFIFDASTSKANRLERKPILGAFELQRCVVAARVRLRAERPPHTATARVFSVLTGTDTCTDWNRHLYLRSTSCATVAGTKSRTSAWTTCSCTHCR